MVFPLLDERLIQDGLNNLLRTVITGSPTDLPELCPKHTYNCCLKNKIMKYLLIDAMGLSLLGELSFPLCECPHQADISFWN